MATNNSTIRILSSANRRPGTDGNTTPQVRVVSRTISPTIVNGPSKDRLFDSCKYLRGNSTTDVQVTFGLSEDGVLAEASSELTYVMIRRIEHEGDSGMCFCLAGDAMYDGEHVTFLAYYDAMVRKGVVDIKW